MKRLQTKITLTYLLLTLAAVSLSALGAGMVTRSYLVDRKHDELSERIGVLANLLRSEADPSPQGLDRSIARFAQAMDVRITLIDSLGTVLLDSDIPFADMASLENHLTRPEIQEAQKRGTGMHRRHSAKANEDLLYVAQRVRMDAASGVLRRVHFLRLAARVRDVEAMALKEQAMIVVAGAVVLAGIVLVSVWLSRRITRPMTAIADAVERIRAGDLETHVKVRGNDEIARVAQAVNEMVDKLKQDIVTLKKLERVRSEFFGNVSHELRTPIFSLQGFLETLMEGAIDDPHVKRTFLKKAYEHSVRLNTLLEDLITISHIESGEMKMSLRYFNLHDFLSALVDQYRTTAERNAVHLRLDESSPKDIEALGDKERLRVVFENLLENAIKYNKPGGEVVVSFAAQDGTVRIDIADTGVGIAPEHLDRIFERFYRVDKNRSREVGGTGLGLAIVKHILEAHGSSITVCSEPGKGSTFSFTLRV
ncbi:MAG: hypothetical protein C4326_14645 [Ignavibacteria bacterium]